MHLQVALDLIGEFALTSVLEKQSFESQ